MYGILFCCVVEENLIDVEYLIQIGLCGFVYDVVDVMMMIDVGMEMIIGFEFYKVGMDSVVECICKCVGKVVVYVIFDIDFVDLVFVFGIGMFEVGGFIGYELLQFVCGLFGLDVCVYDFVEVMLMYDLVGVILLFVVNIVYEFMVLMVLRCQWFIW